MSTPLFLGIGRRFITPPLGSQLYGYMPDVYAKTIHDDLTVTAFYFQQGKTKALLVNTTVCLLNTALAQKIQKELEARFQIPGEHIILHATHTHSGPNTAGTVGWGDIDQSYCSSIFCPRIAEAVAEAVSSPVPARLAVTQGESKVGINRRQLDENGKVLLGQNPWGSYDPGMTVLSFADERKKPLASLVHYGCHQTAAGRNTEVSRDWSGVMVDVMERENQGAPCAFFNGPEGDVGPRLTCGETATPPERAHARFADELGAVAAQDAIAIQNHPKCFFTPELSVSHTKLRIPLAPRPSREEAEAFLERYGTRTRNYRGAQVNHYRKVLASYENGYEEKSETSFEQTVIRLGDLAFVSFPFELFSEIGLRIASLSPLAYTLCLSCCNGSFGYFVTQDQLCRKGYEVDVFKTMDIQPLVDNADTYAVQETLRHLRKMTESQ